MRIEARAPTRIDLAGGTLDIWPLYLFHPGAVTVNAAISRYATCVIETPRSGGQEVARSGKGKASKSEPRGAIRLVSRDTRREESFVSLEALTRGERYRLPLLAELVKLFCTRGVDGLRSGSDAVKGGFTLTTDSEAPAGAGIGGSSAMAVAICAALDRLTGAGLGRVEWIHLSRDAEAMVILVPTGTQDHYPPAFGGAAAIHLEAGRERREALRVDLDDLERRIAVCYTGKPRQSGINNWEVYRAHIEGDRRVQRNLERISQVAQAMRVALEAAQWNEAGRLMREEWSFRRRNLPTISTPEIDRIIAAARRAGALSGKVCGAGGGGCVAFLIEPDARVRVESAIAAAGGEVLPVRVDREGVKVEVKAD